MHRTDAPGNVNGLFNDGNPAAGQQATALVAAWFNDIQENLAYVIEEQGIVLTKGDYTQLSDAIVALVSGAVGDGSGNVPTTRNIFTSGLALGGGTLAVDRTINVPKASAAEVAAGADDSKAITPLALIGGVGARLLAGTGYATLLGGIILQWGTATANANGSTTVTLPITFPNQCVHAEFEAGASATNAQDNNPFVSGRSASALTLFSALDGVVFGTFFALGF